MAFLLMSAFPRHACAGDVLSCPIKSNSALNISKCESGAVSTLTGFKLKDGYARKLRKMRQENYWSGRQFELLPLLALLPFLCYRLLVLVHVRWSIHPVRYHL